MDAWHGRQSIVAGVAFDQRAGRGNTPFGSEPDYYSAVVLMRPSVFLSLAAPLNVPDLRQDSLRHLRECVRFGTPLASPTLKLDLPDPAGPAAVAGHEGRHRMLAIRAEAGDVEVPVQLMPRWVRGHRLSDDDITAMRAGMTCEKLGHLVPGPLFGDAWVARRLVPAEVVPGLGRRLG